MHNMIEIDGSLYHADWEDRPLYDNGELIPAHICICFAHSSSECVCGAWNIEIED